MSKRIIRSLKSPVADRAVLELILFMFLRVSTEKRLCRGHHSAFGADFASDNDFNGSSLTAWFESTGRNAASADSGASVCGGPRIHCGTTAAAASTNTIGISGITRRFEID